MAAPPGVRARLRPAAPLRRRPVDTDFGEACDDGPATQPMPMAPGPARPTCPPGALCGDGFLRTAPSSATTARTTARSRSKCSTTCHLKCGDGIVEAGEQCDFGAGRNIGGYNGCNSELHLGPLLRRRHQERDRAVRRRQERRQLRDLHAELHAGAVLRRRSAAEPERGAVRQWARPIQRRAYGLGQCTPRCRPAPFCGDNAVDTAHGEVCDDGADNSDSRPGACKTDCSGYNPPPPTCGNGTVDAGRAVRRRAGERHRRAACATALPAQVRQRVQGSGRAVRRRVNDGSYGTCAPGCTARARTAATAGERTGAVRPRVGQPGATRMARAPARCSARTGPYCGDGRTQSAHEQCDGQAGCGLGCQWVISAIERRPASRGVRRGPFAAAGLSRAWPSHPPSARLHRARELAGPARGLPAIPLRVPRPRNA